MPVNPRVREPPLSVPVTLVSLVTVMVDCLLEKVFQSAAARKPLTVEVACLTCIVVAASKAALPPVMVRTEEVASVKLAGDNVACFPARAVLKSV